jgi:hypothetical protein
MGTQLDFETCKRRLAVLWLLAAGFITTLLVLGSVLGKFQMDGVDKTMLAWQWFLPTLVPTLSVMVTMVVFDARRQSVKQWKVDAFYYRLTRNLSSFYFTIVFIVYAAVVLPDVPNMRAFDTSNWFLPPLQGLLSSSLGVFFLERE